ncbi:transglycosylase domain-containing protein [Exiguobacterium flavidum]|uniref:transglycosylase domain-containing protein n=1 Tax=Exiguobacterium flavidum TaxID=2184695 RepID=UPI000DF78D77|nr:transglycosylase domain-containing protein [Exiguobacterium flavidum]
MRITSGYLILAGLVIFLGFTLVSLTERIDETKKIVDWATNQVARKPLPTYDPITVRYGDEREYIYDGMLRDDLTPKQLPNKIAKTFVAVEDHRFYQHEGYDISGILRAFTQNQNDGDKSQGGSTITQQLARMVYLSNEKTYTRKIKELLLSVALERSYSKEELLASYVNHAYFANNAYGIEAASRTYFDKTARSLSWEEAAYLASIPNNPSLYDPIRFPENTVKRQKRILEKLSGIMPSKKTDTKINVSLHRPPVRYPDYIDAAIRQAVQLTSERQGISFEESRSYLHRSDAQIDLYLDPEVQERAKQAIRVLPQPIEGAFVEIDARTLGVTALVGNKSDVPGQLNRAVQTYRQPGSAIKPLLVYGPYIEKTDAGLRSLIDGRPICYGGHCPRNSGGQTLGDVRLVDAVAFSYNTPALHAFETVFDEGLETIRPFHFSKWSKEDDSYNSALGGLKYGVSVLELTDAYTTIANDGIYSPSSMIKSIKLQDKLIYRHGRKSTRIWSKQTNDTLKDALHAVMTYGTGRLGYADAGYIGGKTGTTNDNKDMWFVGLKNQKVGGIWLGADTPRPFPTEANSTLQVRTWARIVR